MINQKIKITINADYKAVFKFVSDLSNDSYWRDEVLETKLEGPRGLGNVAIETSVLSKWVPVYVQQLWCTCYIADSEITYQTYPNSTHHLQTSRLVVKLASEVTELSYHLAFSPSLAKLGLGFDLPHFIINMVTKYTMKKYLKRLKKQLERED